MSKEDFKLLIPAALGEYLIERKVKHDCERRPIDPNAYYDVWQHKEKAGVLFVVKH